VRGAGRGCAERVVDARGGGADRAGPGWSWQSDAVLLLLLLLLLLISDAALLSLVTGQRCSAYRW